MCANKEPTWTIATKARSERNRNHAAIGWLAVIVTLAAIGAFVLAEGSGDPSDGLQPGAAAPAPIEPAQ